MVVEPTAPVEARLRGRGSRSNPSNRFERLTYVPTPEEEGDAEGERLRTEFFRDPSRSILARNESPDVGFDVSVNPYRGCEHGCIYCYARPTHEYLSLSAGLDFETRIFVKEEAPALLRRALLSRSWKPEPIALSGVTDPYQPVERHMRLTRGCLEVLREFRNPVVVVTKSRLVTRDRDLLAELAGWRGAVVNLSVTTLEPRLAHAMEPRASTPALRLRAVRLLAEAGIPVRVLMGPVIPGLTDHELPAVLAAAAEAGAGGAGYVMLRLPHAVRDLFIDWLKREVPARARRVLERLREVRGGELSDSRFHSRMRGQGEYALQIRRLFEVNCRRLGLNAEPTVLSVEAFRRPAPGGQRELF